MKRGTGLISLSLVLVLICSIATAGPAKSEEKGKSQRSIGRLVEVLGETGDHYYSPMYPKWPGSDVNQRWWLIGEEKRLAEYGKKAVKEIGRLLMREGSGGEKDRDRKEFALQPRWPVSRRGVGSAARIRAVVVLVHIGGKEARGVLIKALGAVEDPGMGGWILKGLGRLGDKKALPVVERYLDHPDMNVCQGAAYAAAKLGSRRGFEVLSFLARYPQTESVDLFVEAGGCREIGGLVELLELTPGSFAAREYVQKYLGRLIERWYSSRKEADNRYFVFSSYASGFGVDWPHVPTGMYRLWWNKNRWEILKQDNEERKQRKEGEPKTDPENR